MKFDEALYAEIMKNPPTLHTRRLARILEFSEEHPLSARAMALAKMESMARGIVGVSLGAPVDWSAPVSVNGGTAAAINWQAILSAILAMLPQILALFGL